MARGLGSEFLLPTDKKKADAAIPSWDCTPAYFATNFLQLRRSLFAKPAEYSKPSRLYVASELYIIRSELNTEGLYAVERGDVNHRDHSMRLELSPLSVAGAGLPSKPAARAFAIITAITIKQGRTIESRER